MKMKGFLILACFLILEGGTFANVYKKTSEKRITNGPVSSQPVIFTGAKNFKSSVRNIAALDINSFIGVSIFDIKDIHVRALKDFQVRFNDAINVVWYTYGDGFMSYFKKDGYGDRAFYNNKGRWQYSVIFYGEDQLPEDVRAAVKSSYFDLAISIVEEVQTNDGKVYIVYLEDKSNIRILKASTDGRLETLTELIRE